MDSIFFNANDDSDRSISEEEVLDCELRESRISLGVHTDEQLCFSSRVSDYEGFRLQSKLQKLKDIYEEELNPSTVSNVGYEKQTSFPDEDEVEMPDFPDEGDFIYHWKNASAKEVISDDEGRTSTWDYANKEAEELLHLNGDAYGAPSCKGSSSRGARSKAKPKFSFCFQTHEAGSSLLYSNNENQVSFNPREVHENLESIELDMTDSPIDELTQEFQEEKERILVREPAEAEAETETIAPGFTEYSMAERLHVLQDGVFHLKENSKHSKKRSGRIQPVGCGSLASHGDRKIESEEQPEHVGSGSSSDGEDNQHLNFSVQDMKGKTMTDRFQEALGPSCAGALALAPKPSGIGLFGRLQQVIHSEKEQDAMFLKSQLKSCSNYKPNCMDVKILSRYLDAKLIVCICFDPKNIESGEWPNAQEVTDKKSVIFNPRVCSDVELEVGNLIRIHPPWKELPITGTGDSIVLCTYYHQIPT